MPAASLVEHDTGAQEGDDESDATESTLAQEPVKAEQLISAKIGEIHWDIAAHVGVWLCLGVKPSGSRSSPYWTSTQESEYVDAVRQAIRIFCADPNLAEFHASVDQISVGARQGPNCVLSIQAIGHLFCCSPFFRNKFIYVRSLGTKHSLYWDGSAAGFRHFNSIIMRYAQFNTNIVDHSLDVAARVRVEGCLGLGLGLFIHQ